MQHIQSNDGMFYVIKTEKGFLSYYRRDDKAAIVDVEFTPQYTDSIYRYATYEAAERVALKIPGGAIYVSHLSFAIP